MPTTYRRLPHSERGGSKDKLLVRAIQNKKFSYRKMKLEHDRNEVNSDLNKFIIFVAWILRFGYTL
jgi:hypothetical protein